MSPTFVGVRKKAVGTVFIFHASGLAEWVSKSGLRRWLALKAYGQADFALEVAVESIAPHDVFRSDAWEWCPCAAEVPFMERVAPERGRRLEALFVGSLQEGKGILEIVKTAAVLQERGYGDRIRLKVVGRWFSDEFRQETERLVKALGVGDTVLLAGELTGEAKWQAYREADIFFFPSHYRSEASPIVLMEALGAGLPVVTTNWRGIPTLMEGCESGWLLPTRSPERYADALIEIEGRRKRFSRLLREASRRLYEGRYQSGAFHRQDRAGAGSPLASPSRCIEGCSVFGARKRTCVAGLAGFQPIRGARRRGGLGGSGDIV